MKAPSLKRLTEKDLEGLGEPGTVLLQTLTAMHDTLLEALSGGLTLGNLRCQTKHLEFSVPASGWGAPPRYASTLSGPVKMLLVGQLENLTDGVTCSYVQPRWQNASAGGAAQVEITDWPDITVGKSYRATVLTFGEG